MIDAKRIRKWTDGERHPCYIIAEAGVNHNGNLDLALRLVDEAAKAGADAVKFQTFTAEEVASINAPKAAYQLLTTDQNESQYEMLKRLELNPNDFILIRNHCQSKDIDFLSTPYGLSSADLLEELGVDAFKIPSGELTNHLLLAHLAAKGRPLIVSTGMATLSEVETAIEVIQKAGNPPVVLLHCVSAYPALAEEANLRSMWTMAQRFNLPVGFSDHTMGNEVALAAVALGAHLIEKHFTLDRGLPGPDHRSSAEPRDLKALIESIRKVEAALGNGRKEPTPGERENRNIARRSLVAAVDIAVGEVLRADMITFQRPGNGLGLEKLPEILGRVTQQPIAAGTPITYEMLA